jgi:hypothetical protein
MAIDFPASPTLNDVFTVGNVTYVWDGTKWTASVTGGISLDKIEEGNTSAEVIDTGSDGRFVVTTEGTERLRVTNTGLVGIGTNSLAYETLTVQSSSADVVAKFAGPTDPATWIQFTDNTTSDQAVMIGCIGNDLRLRAGSAERMRIDNSGRVGIGTSAPRVNVHIFGTASNAPTLGVASGSLIVGPGDRDYGLAMGTAAAGYSWIQSQNFISPGAAYSLLLQPSGGNVGIGTTSPPANLTVANSGAEGFEFIPGQGSNLNRLQNYNRSGSVYCAFRIDASQHEFYINGTERVRIDSSGRLLVGTSTSNSNTNSKFQIADTSGNVTTTSYSANNSNAGYYYFFKTRGTSVDSHTVLQSGDGIANLFFAGSDGTTYRGAASIEAVADGGWSSGDAPGRLVFSTTADGASNPTERMRISQNGAVSVRSTGNYPFVSNSSSAPGTTATLFAGNCNAADLVGTGATTVFIVYNNGNVQNTNNSYAGISDIKLKENIVDATSQWNDLKSLQVRNYNFKEGQTHTQIGLVAQEVELVSPGLVTESPDRDEDGNDLGTVTKSVNYSVLYMKAVKALQEAMTRIETLEGMVAVNNITIDEQQHQLSTLAARLTALESA